MKKPLITSLVLLAACGGSGGDVGTGTDSSSPGVAASSTPPQPTTYTCEANGTLYFCMADNCSPASSTAEAPAEEAPLVVEEGMKAITVNGSIVIVAECGANVNFNLDGSDTTTTTTTTGAGGNSSLANS